MKQPLFRFYADNRKYFPGLIVVIGISLLSGALKLLVSTLWGKAVDFGVAGEISKMTFSVALMFGVILLDCCRTACQYHIIGNVTERMFVKVRTRAFSKIAAGDVAVLEMKFRSGDTATRINNDIEQISTFVAGHVSNFSRLIFQALFALCGCLFLSWQLTVVTCLVIPLSVWLVKRISIPIQKQSKRSLDCVGSAMSVVADTVSGIFTVKAFEMEPVMAERFDKDVDAAYEQIVKTEQVGMKMTGVKYLTNVIQIMLLFLFGAWLVQNGILSVGTLITFIALSNYITETVGQGDYMISQFRYATACAQRLYEVLDIPDEQLGIRNGDVSEKPCQMEDVGFAYADRTTVLHDVNIQVEKGKKIAVVGASGSGKSTLIKLICRFYLPQKGKLSLFGIRTEDWQPEALRKHMAIVTQVPVLFDGSVYENIAYGRPGTSREECMVALEQANLLEFIKQHPDGIDHPIGEYGKKLSGGQKQRLCIARAMVKQAPLVLLDEATSALDTQTEREVQKALDKLLEGRSAVIVTHRLISAQNADYVYYLDGGKVVEEGSPKELLALKGKYFDMCRRQGIVASDSGEPI